MYPRVSYQRLCPQPLGASSPEVIRKKIWYQWWCDHRIFNYLSKEMLCFLGGRKSLKPPQDQQIYSNQFSGYRDLKLQTDRHQATLYYRYPFITILLFPNNWSSFVWLVGSITSLVQTLKLITFPLLYNSLCLSVCPSEML